MKINPSKALLTLLLGLAVTLTLNAQTPKNFIGTWDQKAPDAPGYETGKVVIEKQSVTSTFGENSYKYVANQVKYKSDTLKFNMDVDDEYVKCYLVVKDKDNLTGFATWSSGETVLILTRSKE